MTRQQAKEITLKKCLHRQVHLDGTYFDPVTGVTTRDMSHLVELVERELELDTMPVWFASAGLPRGQVPGAIEIAQDFELYEFHIVSTPIVARPNSILRRNTP